MLDAILKKPGRLTAEEFAEMKKHPMHGVRILANIQGLAVAAVLPGVQYHHERWDGSGYPEGLRGDRIPLLGRLLGVADFYDAVTSARAYWPAIPQAEAVAMIVDGAGSHFDPEIVKAVIRLHRRGDLLPSNWKHLLPMRDAAGRTGAGAAMRLAGAGFGGSAGPVAESDARHSAGFRPSASTICTSAPTISPRH